MNRRNKSPHAEEFKKIYVAIPLLKCELHIVTSFQRIHCAKKERE